MPRTKVKAASRHEEVFSLLKRAGKDAKNCFEAGLDATIYGGRRSEFVSFYNYKDWFLDVGILQYDLVVIDISKTETPDRNAIICSVVTDDRDFDDYLDFEMEEEYGQGDILDVEFLYPEESEDGRKRRKRKGDDPQLKRHIVGVVTHILRSSKNLHPATAAIAAEGGV